MIYAVTVYYVFRVFPEGKPHKTQSVWRYFYSFLGSLRSFLLIQIFANSFYYTYNFVSIAP